MTTLDPGTAQNPNPDYQYQKAIQDFCIGPESTADYSRLDYLIYSEYGDRPISPFVSMLLGDNKELDDFARMNVAKQLFYQLQESWLRLFNTMSTSYNPLDNYSMKESGTDKDHDQNQGFRNDRSRETIINSHGPTDQETQFPSFTQTPYGTDYKLEISSEVSAKNKNSISTFDASPKLVSTNTTEAPDSEVEGAANKSTTTPIGVQSNDAHSWGYKKHEHDFQRAGNIGVTTSTQMLEADARYWSANDFYDIVASQIASIITNPYYE